MSIVLCYASSGIALMASDGLVVDMNNNPVKENMKKIRHLKSDVLIGYAGNLNLCLDIVGRIGDNFNFEQTYDFIQRSIPLQNSCDKRSFIVCGLSKSNLMSMYTVSYTEAPKIYCAKDFPVYSGLYPDDFPKNDIFKKNILKYGPKKGMEQTIKYSSIHSKSTNSQVLFDMISFVRV